MRNRITNRHSSYQSLLILWVCCTWSVYTFGQGSPSIELRHNDAEKQVDVTIDGELFTSYLYHDHLKKPVLWPLMSVEGNMLTRSYPIKVKPGDRVDHPHHVGVWLNYGDVNGLDFWNNSQNVSPEKKHRYGTIYHRSIEEVKSGKGKARLITTADWKSPDLEVLLTERSHYVFSVQDGLRIIDRTTTLTAAAPEVIFRDNKEGMFAIRVARELELPSDGSTKLVGADGNVVETDQVDNSLVTGNYLSTSGITGSSVWGTRSRWMKLYGTINGEQVALVIIDHPANTGYPTYWHARGYGLFSANTLGQAVFSKGEQELNFSLKKAESETFKYRLVVASGSLDRDRIDRLADRFAKK